jgi:hypothetical protein
MLRPWEKKDNYPMAFNHSWQVALHPGQSDDFSTLDNPSQFMADAHGFSPVNAWWLSELSRLIYKRDHTEGMASPMSRGDYLGRVGLKESRFFNHANIQAVLVESTAPGKASFAVLVFRGTAGPLSNWRFNLDMAACPWPAGGRVHRGFGHLLMQIWENIATSLDQIHQPLFFTGHSLGGALAILSASMHAPHAVYTFGAPLIGDRTFARTLSSVSIYNVVNPHDVVTQLPPASPGFRFSRVGAIVQNTEHVPSRRPLGQAPKFLAGHAPLNYTAQLPVAFDN